MEWMTLGPAVVAAQMYAPVCWQTRAWGMGLLKGKDVKFPDATPADTTDEDEVCIAYTSSSRPQMPPM